MAKLSLKAVGEVTKWFMSPVEAPVPLSAESATAWSSYKFDSFGDYSAWADVQTPAVSVADLDVVANAEAFDIMSSGLAPAESGAETIQAAGAMSSGAVEPAAVAPSGIGNLGTLTAGLATAAALVDIGFTIAGNSPDAAKAVNVALDAIIIVAVWIPVYGWAIALVAGIVKGILGLFASDLWGSGLSHEQREAAEANRALVQGAAPFGMEVGKALTPRDAVRSIIHWTSGYCGGVMNVAVMGWMTNPDNPREAFGFANNPCYWNAGAKYRDWPDASMMTLDDQAIALAKYGATDFSVSIQAGVNPAFLAGANVSLADMVRKKAAAWGQMIEQGLTLDGIEVIADEQRKQPYLNDVAGFFGYRDWHKIVQWHLQDYWTRYIVTNREGTLQDFARKLGALDWRALRDEVIAGYDAMRQRVFSLDARLAAVDGLPLSAETIPESPGPTEGLRRRIDDVRARVEANEAMLRAAQADLAARQAASPVGVMSMP